MDFRGLFFVFAGLFTLTGAACDWDWFMNHHKAQFLVKIFGRGGTRVFYGLLGSLIAGVGFAATVGIIHLGN
jgi:hypothetical protein